MKTLLLLVTLTLSLTSKADVHCEEPAFVGGPLKASAVVKTTTVDFSIGFPTGSIVRGKFKQLDDALLAAGFITKDEFTEKVEVKNMDTRECGQVTSKGLITCITRTSLPVKLLIVSKVAGTKKKEIDLNSISTNFSFSRRAFEKANLDSTTYAKHNHVVYLTLEIKSSANKSYYALINIEFNTACKS